MKLRYTFVRESNDIGDWHKKLPIPYNLKKVEEADKKYEFLKMKYNL